MEKHNWHCTAIGFQWPQQALEDRDMGKSQMLGAVSNQTSSCNWVGIDEWKFLVILMANRNMSTQGWGAGCWQRRRNSCCFLVASTSRGIYSVFFAFWKFDTCHLYGPAKAESIYVHFVLIRTLIFVVQILVQIWLRQLFLARASKSLHSLHPALRQKSNFWPCRGIFCTLGDLSDRLCEVALASRVSRFSKKPSHVFRRGK